MARFQFNKKFPFYLFLWGTFLYYSCHSLTSTELEELAPYYGRIYEASVRGNTSELFRLKDEIEKREFRLLSKHKAPKEIENFSKTVGLDGRTGDFLNKSLGEHRRLQEFIGFFFYPHQLLRESIKTNFNQLSITLKAGILIAAEFDFKPARALIKASSLGGPQDIVISTEEEVDSFLERPFCFEDVGILNEIKSFILKDSHLDRLVERAKGSEDPTYVLNTGTLLKRLELNDLSKGILRRADGLGSKRACIELGFLLLEQDFGEGLKFFESSDLSARGLVAYGLWKLAQCYQYGLNTPRDLVAANEFYLRAVRISCSDPSQRFPEVHYGAGEFAVYCALSQPERGQKINALQQAMIHFQKAGEFGMEVAFVKEAEVAEKLIDLKVLSLEILVHIAHRAATVGYFSSAKKIADKYSILIPPFPGTLPIWAEAEQLGNVYKELTVKLSKGAHKW